MENGMVLGLHHISEIQNVGKKDESQILQHHICVIHIERSYKEVEVKVLRRIAISWAYFSALSYMFYEEWDYTETPYAICKIIGKDKVVFNKIHPLFKTKLNDEIIKSLAIGLILAVKGSQNKAKLLKDLNNLLNDVFLRD